MQYRGFLFRDNTFKVIPFDGYCKNLIHRYKYYDSTNLVVINDSEEKALLAIKDYLITKRLNLLDEIAVIEDNIRKINDRVKDLYS